MAESFKPENLSMFTDNLSMYTTLLQQPYNPTGNRSDIMDNVYSNNYQFNLGYRIKTILSMPNNVIALILGTIAITANILSILAISRMCYSQLTSHFRLILNLAVSDILIGVSLIMFIFINASVELLPVGLGPDDKRLMSRCLFCFSKALNSTALAITLLNLMGMAVDHYIAIMHPLRYDVILKRDHSLCMIALLWILAIIFGFSDFFSAYPKYSLYSKKFNFCEFVHLTKYNEEYTLFALALICLIIMLIIYIRIYLEVKKHHNRLAQVSQDLQRNKKAIVTTLLILGTFILCWLPMCAFSVILVIQVSLNPEAVQKNLPVLHKVDSYLFNLLLFNAIADPVIYAARMREVRAGWRHLCCRFNIQPNRHLGSNEGTQDTTFLDFPQKISQTSQSLVSGREDNQTTVSMLKGME